MITGINGTTGIIENTLLLLVVDRVGRIWPLTIGAFGMSACMLVNAILNRYFPAGAAHPNDNALRAQVAMNFVFQLAFQSLGSISWIYPAEIFPTEIRALGASISALSNWVCACRHTSLVTPTSTPPSPSPILSKNEPYIDMDPNISRL